MVDKGADDNFAGAGGEAVCEDDGVGVVEGGGV